MLVQNVKPIVVCARSRLKTVTKTLKLEIRDSQNLAKLGHGCTTKLIDGGRERIEFRFNYRRGWVATMVPNCELRSTFWFPVVSM